VVGRVAHLIVASSFLKLGDENSSTRPLTRENVQVVEQVLCRKLDDAFLVGSEGSPLHQEKLKFFTHADEVLYFPTESKHGDLLVILRQGILNED